MKPPKVPVPPAAYGPTLKSAIGMNCSFWASAGAAAPKMSANPKTPKRPMPPENPGDLLIANFLLFSMRCRVEQDMPRERSMRKRPEAQLLLGRLPEAREPVGLDGEEEDDQGAEDHQLEVRGEGLAHPAGKERVGE